MALPLITSIIALVFGLTVLQQHWQRPRPFKLVWSVGLLLYATASFLHFLWQAGATAEVVFRLWYLTGAMLVAAYLGMGTLYLLLRRPTAHMIMAGLLILTVVSVVFALTVPLQADTSLLAGRQLVSVTEGGTRFYPGYVSGVTAFLNSAGAFALVGGALWSAFVFWRRRQHPQRVTSNMLIAIGALVSTTGGTLERFDLPQPHTVALLVGIVVIYGGFLWSQEVFERRGLPFLRRSPS